MVWPHDLRTGGYAVLVDRGGDDLELHPPGPIRTMRGELLEAPGSRAAASLLDDGLYAVIELDGERFWVEPAADDPDDHVVYRGEDAPASDGVCGVDGVVAPANGRAPLGPAGGDGGVAGRLRRRMSG